jgi:hypothetical protein
VPYVQGEELVPMDSIDYDHEAAARRAKGYFDRGGQPEGIGQPLFAGNYHALNNNCEHFAMYCRTGKAVSTQADAAKSSGTALVAGGVAAQIGVRAAVGGAGLVGVSTAGAAVPVGAAVGAATGSVATALGATATTAAAGSTLATAVATTIVSNPITAATVAFTVPTIIALKQMGDTHESGEHIILQQRLEVGESSERLTQKIRRELRAIGVSHLKLERNHFGWYDYKLSFTSHSWDSFAFTDASGAVYKVTTLRNGRHDVKYDSTSPSIVKVTKF